MTKENIEKQMECNHPNWYGPCIDEISRYYKCRECYCLKRDMTLDEWTRRG